jgi:hypothetical protein
MDTPPTDITRRVLLQHAGACGLLAVLGRFASAEVVPVCWGTMLMRLAPGAHRVVRQSRGPRPGTAFALLRACSIRWETNG